MFLALLVGVALSLCLMLGTSGITLYLQIQGGLWPQGNPSWTITSETVSIFDMAQPASQVNVEYALAWPHATANLNVLILLASVNMTVCINATSGGSPEATLNLIAGIPMLYYTSGGMAVTSGTSADVTSIWVTNVTAGQLTILAGFNNPA